MAKRRKIKKSVKYIFYLFIVIIIGVIFSIKKYQDYKYHQTNLYKLTEKGYSLEDSKYIVSKLNNDNELYFINHDKEDNLISVLKEKYFLEKNLYDYLEYKTKNKKTTFKDVIAIVNVHANKDWYDSKLVKDTDIKKGNLILVNKFYKLDKEYIPEDLVSINLSYAYDGNKVTKETNDAFIDMAENAKNDGISLIASSSFRDYEKQEAVYKEFYYSKGISYADKYAARAGHSEHQTGLSIDIFTLGESTTDNFQDSEAFVWLTKNAYKFGFILRYPKDKEYLTGYNYESWHYRYVGKSTAKKINDLGITFDEYYAYYLEK